MAGRNLRARVQVIDYASEAAGQAHGGLRRSEDVHGGRAAHGHCGHAEKFSACSNVLPDLNKPRVIEGCGIGPVEPRGLSRWNVCRIARLATKISVRDNASRDNLRLYGIRKAIEVRLDPAVTFIRAQGIRHHGSDGKVIRCFLRELTCEYPTVHFLRPEPQKNLESVLLRRVLAWYPEHRVELWAMHRHFTSGLG